MQAVILAAGRGRRLGGRLPKCLQQVGGVPLILHQLLSLSDVGIDDVVVVAGFDVASVRDVVGDTARVVLNEAFADTNSLFSLLLARTVVNDDVIILNGDVYAAPELYRVLAESRGDALLYDSGSGHGEEHMKVHLTDGTLIEMAKDLPPERICGENVGMLRFGADTVEHLFTAAADLLAEEGGNTLFMASAVNRVATARPIRCVDVMGSPWIEIDFPKDLHRARSEVYPAATSAVWGWSTDTTARATWR